MNKEMREALGRAIQADRRERINRTQGDYWEVPWEDRSDWAKEVDRQAGEVAVRTYLDRIWPRFQQEIRWQNGAIISEHEFYEALGEEMLQREEEKEG